MSLLLKMAQDILVDARPLKSKADLIKRAYEIAEKYTRNKRFDGRDNWQTVQWLLKDLREGLPQPNEVGFGSGGTWKEDSYGNVVGKNWNVHISCGGYDVRGVLSAGNAGTVEDPFKKYDLSLTLG